MASIILPSLFRPSEVVALVQYKLSLKPNYGHSNDKTRERLYQLLELTSRGFAASVQMLDEELRDAVCLFYLILRGLDTIEDDMTLGLDTKIPYLKTFHERIHEEGWNFTKNPMLAKRKDLSKSMGIFFQKINIITDYLVDFREKRFFWPKEIWGEYCEKFEDLINPENKDQALQCLTHMVLDAMRHIEAVLEFLSMVKNPSCFKAGALPQVVSIATLSMLCGNYKLFTHEDLKIRKGEAVWLMKESNNIATVAAIFRMYTERISNKVSPSDPHFEEIGITCSEIERICESKYPASKAELKRLQAGVMAGPTYTIYPIPSMGKISAT
ncbi:Farnesyl-diphosphate farnesyltransferase [Podila verticillata]|nr:Farnesyl-diphosphate farnesyltransferase [Podila verticillata]